ncbi:MAG TPA: cytochrome c biogenesis protein DipZ [Acidimicrobiales bacterium]|nr:cytochrome c biogenesis protein DipZ [Acidimicrobiales bacterium]
MILLYLIAFVAGLVVGISPCILPVLPIILVAGLTTPVEETTTRSYRAYAVIAGLVLSFCVFTLAGSELLSALQLPQDLLRDAGLVILGVVGVGLLIPAVGEIVERPFARLGARHQPTGTTSGFVLGLGLGVLFTPCAGPILSAITVASANHRVSLSSIVLTADFALGAAVALLAFALLGQRAAAIFRTHAILARRIGGAVLAVMTLVLAFNWTDGLQTHVPGYTSALQRTFEGSAYAKKHLEALEGTAGGSLANCTPGTALVRCGQAPAFTGISRWLNTPGGKPISLASLRGKVVLVDFWTYSCINCQRSLPHVEAWYGRYHADGLEVVGVHTPEFAFEHVVSNVVTASHELGVRYPIAVDNGYKTWDAYSNMYWPAEYLIDAGGQVRHVEDGEGDYGATESLIRTLLVASDPKVQLPPPTGVADRTPVNPLTPETYLGYKYELQNLANPSILPDRPEGYRFPASLPRDSFALSGTWTAGSEEMTAGPAARIELSFQADDVYLVLGGSGTLDVTVGDSRTKTITVSGTPRLYTLVKGGYQDATVTLSASPGIEAYDFTFG